MKPTSRPRPRQLSPAGQVGRYLRDALEALPAEYAGELDNIAFGVQRALSPRDRRRLGPGNGQLYGLYEGTPLTQRGAFYNRVVPDRITLYWGPLARDFPDASALREEVRKTLYHEIAHYFGLDEADLHRTSVE